MLHPVPGITHDMLLAAVFGWDKAMYSLVLGFDDNALITIGNVEVTGKRYKKKAIH